MLCEPTARALLDTLAEPVAETALVPSAFAPSRKVTLPPGLFPLTLAVQVTSCPKLPGFALELTLVVLAAATARTVCVKGGDVLASWLASPEYPMLIACVPTLSVDTLNTGAPPLKF